MIISDNALNILVAKNYKGIGRAWIVKNLKGNESVDAVVSLINRAAKNSYRITVKDFNTNKEKLTEFILKLKEYVDGVVGLGDENFPQHRGNVKSSERPVALFYRGNLSLLTKSNKNCAVIGLLNPDKEIEIMEQLVVSKLVECGATIISGLALGCDTIAHRQALYSGGKTIAILPSPLTNILPATNLELANEIVEKDGLITSEYYENVKSKRELVGRYQERDRLQALFSDTIVLSASYAKNDQGNDSGSRLTMEYAASYSIPRAVIYDNTIAKENPKYDLNRQLISEQKDITIINRKNIVTTISRLLVEKQNLQSRQPIQSGLFD